jgi:glycosyltransferase involved in cell wall biosynthesis
MIPGGGGAAAVGPEYMVSVLFVVGNDEAVLADFLAEVRGVLEAHYRFYEIVVADNASTDGSAAVLRHEVGARPNLRWLRLSRENGGEVALAAALDHCIGDYAVVMDLYHDPPALIPVLVEAAARESAVAVGRRTREVLPWLHRFLRRGFFWAANRVLESRIDPDAYSFRVFPRQAVNALTRIKNRRRHLHYFSALAGHKQVAVPFRPVHRRGGRRARSLLGSLGAAADLVLSNSLAPLRWTARLGLLASLLNLLYLVYVFVVALVKERLAEGWFTLSVTSTVMFLCLFLVLAVLVEYVGRILEEAQDRPLYFLEHATDSPAAQRPPREWINVA